MAKKPSKSPSKSLKSSPASPASKTRRAKNADANFIAACKSAGITLPSSRAELIKNLQTMKCATIIGETTGDLRERVASLLWALRFRKRSELHSKLSDSQVVTLRAVYGNNVRHVRPDKLVNAVNAYYLAAVASPESSDAEVVSQTSDDDNDGGTDKSAGDPLALTRPDPKSSTSNPRSKAAHNQPASARATAASITSTRSNWRWPESTRRAMRLARTFTPEDVKHFNALAKCADIFGPEDGDDDTGLFSLSNARFSDQIRFIDTTSGMFSSGEGGKQLFRASLFFSTNAPDYVHRSRAIADRSERAKLADSLRRQAMPGVQDPGQFWATDHLVANYVTALFEERAMAAADLARQYGSQDIADRMMKQFLELPGYIQQVRRFVTELSSSVDPDQADAAARQHMAGFWMPILAPARFFMRTDKIRRDLAYALGVPSTAAPARKRHREYLEPPGDEPAHDTAGPVPRAKIFSRTPALARSAAPAAAGTFTDQDDDQSISDDSCALRAHADGSEASDLDHE